MVKRPDLGPGSHGGGPKDPDDVPKVVPYEPDSDEEGSDDDDSGG